MTRTSPSRRFLDLAPKFEPDSVNSKLEALRLLARTRLATLQDIVAVHEALLFARAYPADPACLEATEALLRDFAERKELRKFAADLVNSGIAGTELRFPCWWAMARWLAATWPDQLELDWEDFANAQQLDKIWHLLLPHCESPYLDEFDRSPRDWLAALSSESESDAAFLIRRFDAMDLGPLARETLYDNLDVPLRLRPVVDKANAQRCTPSRTLDRYPWPRIAFQTTELDRSRPDLTVEARRGPEHVETLSKADGRRLIALARAAMLTRTRDLDGFANANEDDARLVHCGDGLAFGMLGLVPERRLMFDSSYALLTLKNGVPIGYVLISALFGSAAIAYNVFEAFRGGEAAKVLGRVLGVARHIFGVDSFSIDPYQLGHNNSEGLASGAWWFYYKLGFRPRDAAVQRVLRRELAAMKRDPQHRSSEAVMRELVVDTMHFHLGKQRDDVLGIVSLATIGQRISEALAAEFGSTREHGLDVCEERAAKLCGVTRRTGWSRGQALWWRRWSPLLTLLPGVERWPIEDRRRLVEVVRAKGGAHESDFVPLCDGFPRLRKALLRLAAD